MRVASKVWNLRSEFGHTWPSGSPVIRYVRDGRTDRQEQTLLPPSYGRGHNNSVYTVDDNVVLSSQQFDGGHSGQLMNAMKPAGSWQIILRCSRMTYAAAGVH